MNVSHMFFFTKKLKVIYTIQFIGLKISISLYGKFFFLLKQKKHKLKGKTRLFNKN